MGPLQYRFTISTQRRLIGALACALVASASIAAGVPDTMAQRALACTGCHGPQGRSLPTGYAPRIAGKPAAYLTQQLIAFRDGRRQQNGMARLLVNLSDDYLAELAGHFSSLKVAYPPPPASTAPPESLELGRHLVRDGDPARGLNACTDCHGSAMTGVTPAIPGLLGLPRDYLVKQLGSWRIGERRARTPDCMAAVARRMQSRDIVAVADWLAAQALPADPAPVEKLPQPLPTRCGSTAS